MSVYCSKPSNPQPLLFVECKYGRLGVEFQATDRDQNSRAEIVRQVRSGEIDVLRVLEVDEADGTCRDVTADILAEAAVPREPRTLDQSAEALREMLDDHERGLMRDSIYGWPT